MSWERVFDCRDSPMSASDYPVVRLLDLAKWALIGGAFIYILYDTLKLMVLMRGRRRGGRKRRDKRGKA
jgi:hypothetical protein